MRVHGVCLMIKVVLFVLFDSLHPINNLSVKQHSTTDSLRSLDKSFLEYL